MNHCIKLPAGAGQIDFDFKGVDVRAKRVACVIGMPPFNWDIVPERFGFCGNCDHEFKESDQVFCHSFLKKGVELARFYCNQDCARYCERERLRPSLQKYAVVLQDWKNLVDRVLELREDPDPPIGSFETLEECTAFVKLQRRIVGILLNAINSILARNTKMYLLYKRKLQEEWCDMLALCVNDAMTMHTAAEMKQFASIVTVAHFFVDDEKA